MLLAVVVYLLSLGFHSFKGMTFLLHQPGLCSLLIIFNIHISLSGVCSIWPLDRTVGNPRLALDQALSAKAREVSAAWQGLLSTSSLCISSYLASTRGVKCPEIPHPHQHRSFSFHLQPRGISLAHRASGTGSFCACLGLYPDLGILRATRWCAGLEPGTMDPQKLLVVACFPTAVV